MSFQMISIAKLQLNKYLSNKHISYFTRKLTINEEKNKFNYIPDFIFMCI
jgi:hypothetical protein